MAEKRVQKGVHEGFPNPAIDGTSIPMDLNKMVVKNPTSTFYMRVTSDSYEKLGIYGGDIVVIDRSYQAKPGRLAVTISDGEFTIRPLPHNYETDVELWGVVTHVIHKTL